MDVIHYLNIFEVAVLAVIIIFILKSYASTKNRKLLLGAFAFFLFMISCTAIFIRHVYDAAGIFRIVLYLLDFGYLAGMILILGVYRKDD